MNNFMNNVMNSIRRVMYGRYGIDQYTRGLVIIALILSVIATFTRNGVLVLISYIPFIYAFFRSFSRNIPRRAQENALYCSGLNKLKKKLNDWKLALIGTKTHKYFKCSKCKQTIRVPRGKGKICITCPKCKAEFVRKT